MSTELAQPMFSTNIVKATPPTSEKRKRDLKDDPVTPKQPGKKQKPSKNLGNSSRDKTGESKDTGKGLFVCMNVCFDWSDFHLTLERKQAKRTRIEFLEF